MGEELDIERSIWTGIKRITGSINGGDARLCMRSLTGDLFLSWELY